MMEATTVGEEKIVGIDLGTTYTRIAVWSATDGAVQLIPNDHGNRRTPAMVAFTAHKRVLGEAAAHQMPNNVSNTLYDIKRLIGKRFCDPRVQTDMKRWPFTVLSGTKGEPVYQVTYKDDVKTLSPIEITAMILARSKLLAERHLKTKVTKAVVTVPACFNDTQRRATKDAAAIAGFSSVKIFNEASAAAMAYAQQPQVYVCDNVKCILVVDLGGGKLDVSVLTVHGGALEVKASAGDTHIGGADLETKLMEFCIRHFKRTHGDITWSSKALRRLRLECQNAIRCLSTASETVLDVDSVHNETDFHLLLKRAELDELNVEFLSRCLQVVRQCVEDAGINNEDINEIVLVGGTSRVPKLREILAETFPGRPFCKSVNAEEAVVVGAALKAAAWNKDLGFHLSLADVTPLTLVFPLSAGASHVIFRRNTAIPAVNVVKINPDRTQLMIPLFQCARGDIHDNNFLGEFVLGDLRHSRSRNAALEVEFYLDAQGFLSVSAWDVHAGCHIEGHFGDRGGRMNETDMQNMFGEMRRFQKDDEEAERKHVLMNDFQQYIHIMRIVVKERYKPGESHGVDRVLDGAENWLGDNDSALVPEILDKLSMARKEIHKFFAQLPNSPRAAAARSRQTRQ